MLNEDPNNNNRLSAAVALGHIGPAAKAAVPSLIRGLKEGNYYCQRREAAIALGMIGDPSALPALKAAKNYPEIDVRIIAAQIDRGNPEGERFGGAGPGNRRNARETADPDGLEQGRLQDRAIRQR